MNRYRSAVLALAAGAAAVSLAACSVGITNNIPGTPRPGGTSSSGRLVTHSACAAAGSDTATRVHVGGQIGSFPIPPQAVMIENSTHKNRIVLVFNSVSPASVSHFYTSALPHEGYTITTNTLATLNSQAGAGIEFTGHGYKGTIGAGTMLANPSACTGGAFGQDFVTITLTPV
jgi:hypothetical protein